MIIPIIYKIVHIDYSIENRQNKAMNEKKSPFGDLCHQYRGSNHLSEQTMGQKIEELGYRLGAKPGGNKQPVVSQFEREIDPEDAKRRQHRDPPLEYVETCAKLFMLSSEQKYALFEAALQSSEKIVINKKAIEGGIKDDIIQLITSLILSFTEMDKIIEKDKKRGYLDGSQLKLKHYWEALNKASQGFIEEIKKHALEYKNPSS
jgi:hypothetical protein